MKLGKLACLYALMAPSSVLAAQTYDIQEITLPSGISSVQIAGINSSQSVVLNCFFPISSSEVVSRPYVWSAGTLTALPLPTGASGGAASAINNLGTIGGSVFDAAGVSHPVLWNSNNITVLDQGGAASGAVSAINDSGAVLGTLHSPAGDSFIATWSGATLTNKTSYGQGAATTLVPVFLNQNGQALFNVFTFALSPVPISTPSAYLRTSGIDLPLGDFGAYTVEAHGLNNSGDVVGLGTHLDLDQGTADYIGFLRHQGQFSTLPTLSGASSDDPWAINDEGTIVGESVGIYHATLWQNGQAFDLNDEIPANAGWELSNAAAINDNGAIAGIGLLNGDSAAFLLTPTGAGTSAAVPEAGTMGVMVLGGALLLRRRRAGRMDLGKLL